MKRFLALALLVAFIGCGKRGDPKPPVPMIPQATSDLVVTQRGSRVILTWSYPALTTAGRALKEVRAVEIHRYVEPLPAAAATPDPNVTVDPTEPPPITLFARVPPPAPPQFAKLATEIESIASTELTNATVGSKLFYEDTPAFHAVDGRPVRLTYAVVTRGMSAKSDLSNLATIVPVDVPAPPPNLTATAKPEGVALDWKAPGSATSQGRPFIIGYNIYRSSVSAPSEELDVPINTSPAKDPNYLDTPSFGEHRYRVTAVTSTSPRIESDPSAPVTVTFKDLMPPPAPASVVALVETKAVRLIWDAVEAADFAGYRIYRTEGMGHGDDITIAGTFPILFGPLNATTWTDVGPSLGIAYRYGVASLDKGGNESKAVWTEWVVVPKTP